jgi:ATP-binding cassette subfamily B (MDR/TAP) protein 1
MKSVPYAPAVGSLMYVMVATRPDIAYAVGLVSRFMHNPGRPHWNVVKHIFIYLMGTQDYGIKFGPNEPLGLVGFTDSDYAGCLDTRKSTTGYFFKFRTGAISWRSKLQECTATSTTEAEYVGASDAAKEALWLGQLARTFRQCNSKWILTVFSDSQGAVVLAKNPVHHNASKHIEVRYHFVRDCAT